MIQKDNKKEKRDYAKPRLTTIRLVAEEVLGLSCKSISQAGSDPQGQVGCFGASCRDVGS